MRFLLILIAFLSLLPFYTSASEKKTLNVVVLANKGYEEAFKKWLPLSDYLQEKTGYKINLIPYNFLQLEGALQNKTTDILITNPQYFVIFQERYGIKPIATLKKGEYTHACGVIIARKDSGIKNLEDIVGKKIAIVSKESAFGYLAQTSLLLEKGIDIREKSEIWSAENQANVAYAVYNNAFQVGFLNAEIYDNLVASKKINSEELIIINGHKNKNVNYTCSTDAWPDWAVSVSNSMDSETIKKIQSILLSISNDAEALKKINFSFAQPQDYSAVKKALNLLAGIQTPPKEDIKKKKK